MQKPSNGSELWKNIKGKSSVKLLSRQCSWVCCVLIKRPLGCKTFLEFQIVFPILSKNSTTSISHQVQFKIPAVLSGRFVVLLNTYFYACQTDFFFLLYYQLQLNSDLRWMVESALRSPPLSHLWSYPPRNLSPTHVTFRIPLPSHHCTTNSLLLSLQSLSQGSIAQVGYHS